MSFTIDFVAGIVGWTTLFGVLYALYWVPAKIIGKLRGSDVDGGESTDADDSGFVTRRKLIAGSAIVGLSTVGALVPTPESGVDADTMTEHEPDPSGDDDPEPIELVDHEFRPDWETKVYVTVKNNSGETVDTIRATIDAFNGDERVKSSTIRWYDLPDGIQETDWGMAGGVRPDLSNVTHYTITIKTRDGYEKTYEFEGEA